MIPDPPVGDWAREGLEPDGLATDTLVGPIGNAALKTALSAYYALITQIDFQIGRFLLVMAEHELLNNTIFVFLSDHGELLGDHNRFRKYLPYEGSARVPFILYDPGDLLQCKAGSTVDEVVELRDVMPSLLDFASIPVPPGLDGQSVLPLLRQNDGSWREYVHGEHSMDPDGPYLNISNHFLVSAAEKYIWFSQTGREQYFDLVRDPKELHDLAKEPDHALRVAHWRRTLAAELKDREEGYSNGEELIIGRRPVMTLSNCQ
jgi:arylsulfatase A-like enzyme